MLWRAHVGSTKVNFKSQGPILGSRGPDLGLRRVPQKKSGRKTTSFRFWEGAQPTRPGGPSMANFTPVTRALAAPLESRVTRRMPNSEHRKGSKQLGLRRPVRSGRRPVGRARCSVCGAVLDMQGRCCVKSNVTGLHSITNQASFVVKRV